MPPPFSPMYRTSVSPSMSRPVRQAGPCRAFAPLAHPVSVWMCFSLAACQAGTLPHREGFDIEFDVRVHRLPFPGSERRLFLYGPSPTCKTASPALLSPWYHQPSARVTKSGSKGKDTQKHKREISHFVPLPLSLICRAKCKLFSVTKGARHATVQPPTMDRAFYFIKTAEAAVSLSPSISKMLWAQCPIVLFYSPHADLSSFPSMSQARPHGTPLLLCTRLPFAAPIWTVFLQV